MCLPYEKVKELIDEYKVEKLKEMILPAIDMNEKQKEKTSSSKCELENDKRLLEEIKKLEQTEEVRKYLELLDSYNKNYPKNEEINEVEYVKQKVNNTRRG